MKTAFKIAVVSLVIILLLFIWQGETFLIVDNADACRKIDAIVVLAGLLEDSFRVKEGIKVADSKEAQYLILPLRNSGITWHWLADHYNIETPASAEHVIIGNMEPDDKQILKDYGGTFLEAKKTIEIMLEYKLNSAIVVSSAYHMRRSMLAFEKAKEQYPIRFYFHPIRKYLNKSKPWWLDFRYVLRILAEYRKLAISYIIFAT